MYQKNPLIQFAGIPVSGAALKSCFSSLAHPEKKIQALEQKDFLLTEEKYKEGVIAKLDIDQQKENLLNVQRMVYNTEFDCMVDYINFYKSIAAQDING